MKLRILLLPLLAALCLTAGACSNKRTAIATYDANCLWSLQQARDFASQGRYELAKEQYLMAMAACNSPDARKLVTHELRSVDMMIKAQR